MSTDVTEAVAFRRNIAEEIRALLGRRDMSKLELSRRIGKSHTYVWRRLNGETAFDTDDLQRIAAVLGVSVSDLLPKTEGREPTHNYSPGERVLATVGEGRKPRVNHRPVRRTQPMVNGSTRPFTPVAV